MKPTTIILEPKGLQKSLSRIIQIILIISILQPLPIGAFPFIRHARTSQSIKPILSNTQSINLPIPNYPSSSQNKPSGPTYPSVPNYLSVSDYPPLQTKRIDGLIDQTFDGIFDQRNQHLKNSNQRDEVDKLGLGHFDDNEVIADNSFIRSIFAQPSARLNWPPSRNYLSHISTPSSFHANGKGICGDGLGSGWREDLTPSILNFDRINKPYRCDPPKFYNLTSIYSNARLEIEIEFSEPILGGYFSIEICTHPNPTYLNEACFRKIPRDLSDIKISPIHPGYPYLFFLPESDCMKSKIITARYKIPKKWSSDHAILRFIYVSDFDCNPFLDMLPPINRNFRTMRFRNSNSTNVIETPRTWFPQFQASINGKKCSLAVPTQMKTRCDLRRDAIKNCADVHIQTSTNSFMLWNKSEKLQTPTNWDQ